MDAKTKSEAKESSVPSLGTGVVPRLLACFYVTITFACLLVQEVLPQAKDLCPPRFQPLLNQCYFFSSVPSSWDEARHQCHTINAHLVSLETEKEDEAIRNHIDEDERVGYWWTSGNNWNADDSWTWGENKEPIGYFNWCMDCPSAANNSNCLLMGVNCWEDHNCKEHSLDQLPIHFICERTVGNEGEIYDHEEL